MFLLLHREELISINVNMGLVAETTQIPSVRRFLITSLFKKIHSNNSENEEVVPFERKK